MARFRNKFPDTKNSLNPSPSYGNRQPAQEALRWSRRGLATRALAFTAVVGVLSLPPQDTQENAQALGAPIPIEVSSGSTCALDSRPISDAEYLCEDRRKGELLFVLVPGIIPPSESAFDLTDPNGKAKEIAEYTASSLRNLSGGIIDLTPRVTVAQPSVIQAIKDSNPAGCINDQISPMGKVASTTAETDQAKQVVFLGGKACNIKIGGVARYEPKKKTADIYSALPASYGNYLPTAFGGFATHEVLHNFKLDHAGYVVPGGNRGDKILLAYDPTQPVDLRNFTNQASIWPYGDTDNVMSNVACVPLPADICANTGLNPLQKEYITRGAYPDKKDRMTTTPLLHPGDTHTISDAQAAIINLPRDVSDTGIYVVGEDYFSQLAFVPATLNTAAANTRVIDVLLVGYPGAPVHTAIIESFALADNLPREFTFGSLRVSVTLHGNETLVAVA